MDLGARGSCQIGGNLATNAGGNGVLQFGMMREQVLGLEVVLADGTVLDMMRPMIKNNTGYDLKHWFVGSEGTLGIITRAILRLHPAKRARVSTLVALPDYAAAIRLLRLLQSSFPGALAAFELMWEDFFTTSLQWSQTASPFGQTYPFAVLAEVTGNDEGALAESLQEVLAQAMDARPGDGRRGGPDPRPGQRVCGAFARPARSFRRGWTRSTLTSACPSRGSVRSPTPASRPCRNAGPAIEACASAIWATATCT